MTMTLLSLLRACLVQKYQRFWPTLVLFPLLLPPDSYSKVLILGYVCPSVCNSRDPHLNDSTYRKGILLHTIERLLSFLEAKFRDPDRSLSHVLTRQSKTSLGDSVQDETASSATLACAKERYPCQ